MSQYHTSKLIRISAKDLPLHCPTATTPPWSAHPRVFLKLDQNGQVQCPYCSTRYQLVGEQPAGHH